MWNACILPNKCHWSYTVREQSQEHPLFESISIGALGIVMLDSLLTASPAYAYRHVDEGRYEAEDSYGDFESNKWVWLLVFGGALAGSIFITIKSFRAQMDPSRILLTIFFGPGSIFLAVAIWWFYFPETFLF